MVLWGLNVYLDLWKQKYTSQKFSKKYKNPYFCPTLELVKFTMAFGFQSAISLFPVSLAIFFRITKKTNDNYSQTRPEGELEKLAQIFFFGNAVWVNKIKAFQKFLEEK
jgi:hypothetical protein